jgi:glycosyltransferase involved in cell wall biosynthesis
MLRVGLDATSLLGSATGIGRAVSGTLEALAARGDVNDVDDVDDVELAAYALSWRGRGALPGVLPAGVRAVGRPMAAGVLLRLWGLGSFAGPPIEWWTGALDVVHGTNFVVPPARRAGAVVSVWDLTALRYPEMCTPSSLRYPRLIRAALGRGAFVHTASAAVAVEVIDLLGAPPERVRVVAPGVPSHRVPVPVPVPAPGPVPPLGRGPGPVPVPVPSGPPYVLALGTVEPRKDLPGLVRAFATVAAQHRDVQLHIAGPSGWGEEELGLAIAASPFSDRIVRTGWVEDPGALLAGAAVLAYPSRYEGFGFPPLEAMAAGVPVVATAAGSVPEVVGDAARLVAVGDPEALGAALNEVLSDPALAARLVAAGRRRVTDFSWERTAEGLISLYRDVAAAR